jgi:hypothetical protein
MRIILPTQAVRDIYQAVKALDADRVIIDPEKDIAHVWSPDRGAVIGVKLWKKEDPGGPAPLEVIDQTMGNPETPHDAELGRAVAVTILPGREASPMIRSALADLAERRRMAMIHGSKDKSVSIRIEGGHVEIGPFRVEAPTWGNGETVVNGGYLMAAIDHAFGMQAYGVQIEIHEGGVLRIVMQSPNQQTEPDTRWRGQGVLGPVVVRDRLVGLRKAGSDAERS